MRPTLSSHRESVLIPALSVLLLLFAPLCPAIADGYGGTPGSDGKIPFIEITINREEGIALVEVKNLSSLSQGVYLGTSAREAYKDVSDKYGPGAVLGLDTSKEAKFRLWKMKGNSISFTLSDWMEGKSHYFQAFVIDPGAVGGVALSDSLKFFLGSERVIRVATRVFLQNNAQLEFINNHFDFVSTRLRSFLIRNKIRKPKLFLYHSLRGAWEDNNYFDWDHISAHENMFCHNTSPQNPHPNDRILTRWNSWLMNASDLVDQDAPDALNHWVNYFAVTSSNQVYGYGYDGLFIDSAGNKLWPDAVYNLMPDDYSDEKWKAGRYAALKFIRSYFPDKLVVFNGLHQGNSSENNLDHTDGGMWEGFGFDPNTGNYYGEYRWKKVIDLVESKKDQEIITLSTATEGFTGDIQGRIFILASYLLVSNGNVVLHVADLDYDENAEVFYYPELELDIGFPLSGYTVNSKGIYVRTFQKGIVLVNPDASESQTYNLAKTYFKVIPVGGGVLHKNGTYDGSLTYESVSGTIELPPASGAILLD